MVSSSCNVVAKTECKVGFVDGLQAKYLLGTLPATSYSRKLESKTDLMELYVQQQEVVYWKMEKNLALKGWIRDYKKDPTNKSFDAYKSKNETTRKSSFRF